MRLALCVLFALVVSSVAFAKDGIQVEVKAVHAATQTDRSSDQLVEKGVLGAHSPGSTQEVYNLDAIINSEHAILICADPKGCEAPTLGIHSGEMKRRGFMKLTFDIPVTKKTVSRWYRIAGSW